MSSKERALGILAVGGQMMVTLLVMTGMTFALESIFDITTIVLIYLLELLGIAAVFAAYLHITAANGNKDLLERFDAILVRILIAVGVGFLVFLLLFALTAASEFQTDHEITNPTILACIHAVQWLGATISRLF